MAKVKLRSPLFARVQLISVAIWALIVLIFLLDVLTPPEIVSICFAYAIPIFATLFEMRPRPFLYAGAAIVLTFVGTFIQPPDELNEAAVLANRVIAVVVDLLAATLVRLQSRRQVDIHDKAECQRRFIDILSHEVGTALTTINGQAYRLIRLSDQIMPVDLRARAEKIHKAAERIEAIVDRVQLASSLGDGTIPIGSGSINLHDILQQLTDHLKEERRGGSIELTLCPEPQVVKGDEMLLRQVFENVISNSIKYSALNAPISVSVTKLGSASRVTIADHGSGIAHDELLKVRDPYYRGHNSKGTSGAGLGLYFAECIVEAHKGRFFLESEVGKGTNVVIDLLGYTDGSAHE